MQERVMLLGLLLALCLAGCASSKKPGECGLCCCPAEGTPSGTPNPLEFGDVQLGQVGLATLTLANTGGGPLNVANVASAGIKGPSAADFALTRPIPASVEAGATVAIQIRFTPSTLGEADATLSLDTDSYTTPTLTVPLSGFGVASAPTLVFSPSPLVFSGVDAGQSASAVVTANNAQTAAVTVANLFLAGPASAWVFRLTGVPALPLTVQPDAGFKFTVEYAPTGADGGDSDALVASFTAADGGIATTILEDTLSGE